MMCMTIYGVCMFNDFCFNCDGLVKCVYIRINLCITGHDCIAEENFPLTIFRDGK